MRVRADAVNEVAPNDGRLPRGRAVAGSNRQRKREAPFSRGLPGCAGLQLDFPAQQFQGVEEAWVPLEGVIAVGRA